MSPNSAASRIACLRDLHLDHALEDDLVVRLRDIGARIARDFGVGACLISLIETDRQRVVMAHGLDVLEIPTDQSFCVRTVNGVGSLVITDLTEQADLADHPMVSGPPFLRFYAGHALRSTQGLAYGALCVLDSSPRPSWTATETERLSLYAGLISEMFSQRADNIELLNERAMLAHAPTGALIWRAERGLPLIFASENLSRILGQEAVTSLREGQPLDLLIHPEDRTDVRISLMGHVDAGLEKSDLSYRILLPEGGVRWVRQICVVPRLPHTAEPLIFAYLTDETAHRRQEQASALMRERLAVAVEAADIGIYDLNLATSERVIDDRIARMLGYGPGELDSHTDTWWQLVHPFDRQRVEQKIRDLGSWRGVAKLEYRMRHRDRHYVWMQSFGKIAEYFPDGQPKRVIGTLIDISEHKRDEIRRSKQRQLLEVLNQAQAGFMFTHDLKKACDGLFEPLLKLTDSAFGFIGVMRHSATGEPYLLIPTISDLSWNNDTRALYQQHLKDEGLEFHHLDNLFGHVVTHNQVVLTNDLLNHPSARGFPPGHPRLDSFLGVPIRYGTSVVGMIGLANAREGYDQELVELLEPLVTTLGALIHALELELERRRIEVEFERQATTDGLTGLLNRRQFEESGGREVALAARLDVPVSVAIIDLDLFKAINDTYGHAGGDAVLRAFGGHLRRVMRATDLVCRFGGEEFAVLMPGTPANQARDALERLRQEVAACPTPFQDHLIPLTVSVGVSEGHSRDVSLERLLIAADKALYVAKTQGRDQIRLTDRVSDVSPVAS